MRILATIDYVVIASYMAVVFAMGVVLTKRAGASVENFFVGGRRMSW